MWDARQLGPVGKCRLCAGLVAEKVVEAVGLEVGRHGRGARVEAGGDEQAGRLFQRDHEIVALVRNRDVRRPREAPGRGGGRHEILDQRGRRIVDAFVILVRGDAELPRLHDGVRRGAEAVRERDRREALERRRALRLLHGVEHEVVERDAGRHDDAGVERENEDSGHETGGGFRHCAPCVGSPAI